MRYLIQYIFLNKKSELLQNALQVEATSQIYIDMFTGRSYMYRGPRGRPLPQAPRSVVSEGSDSTARGFVSSSSRNRFTHQSTQIRARKKSANSIEENLREKKMCENFSCNIRVSFESYF